MITREQALEFLHQKIQNQNLRRHCYAVAQVMEALALKFKNQNEEIDPNTWWIAGLLHDADYEITKNEPSKHVKTVVSWLKDLNYDSKVINAIDAHGWKFVDGCPKPQNKMEWSLYCCDELTGLIVAVALVKGKKLENVEVESVLKKIPQKAFAASVNREQIKLCEKELGIPLPKFIEIALTAMKSINKELGL